MKALILLLVGAMVVGCAKKEPVREAESVAIIDAEAGMRAATNDAEFEIAAKEAAASQARRGVTARLASKRVEVVAAPAGYWDTGSAGCLPCATQKPNEVQVCPGDGKPYYLRFDASMLWAPPWSGADEAVAAGQGGAAHTTQYDVQTEPGSGIGFKIPLRSGQAYPGAGYIWPAPPRDLPVRNRPGLMLCKVYNDLNGPGAKPCPSGVTAAVYSAQLTAGPEWSGAWPIVNQNFRIPQCQNQPTPSKTPIPPTLPPGVTPTIPPGLPPPCNCQPRPCVLEVP